MLYTPHNSIFISAEQSAFRKLWPSHWFAHAGRGVSSISN